MQDIHTQNHILEESARHIEEILGERYHTIEVQRAVLGLFFTGVKLDSGQGGLCFTPIKEIPEAVCCPSSAAAMPLSGRLGNRLAKDYVRDIFKKNILKRALGIATLNALSMLCWEENGTQGYEIQKGVDAYDAIEVAPSERVVVVGALIPIVKRLLKQGNEFTILEMDKSTLKGKELDHYLPANEAPSVVPDADVLIITGVTVINDTLEGLLALAKKNARIVVTGPTVSMLPDAFFKRGVSVLAGILVDDSDTVLDVIAEGGSGYHFFGKGAEKSAIIRGK